MPIGELEYRDIISWKNKHRNQCWRCEMEGEGGNRREGEDGWKDEGGLGVSCF